jgi:hypothetical protein
MAENRRFHPDDVALAWAKWDLEMDKKKKETYRKHSGKKKRTTNRGDL